MLEVLEAYGEAILEVVKTIDPTPYILAVLVMVLIYGAGWLLLYSRDTWMRPRGFDNFDAKQLFADDMINLLNQREQQGKLDRGEVTYFIDVMGRALNIPALKADRMAQIKAILSAGRKPSVEPPPWEEPVVAEPKAEEAPVKGFAAALKRNLQRTTSK